MKKKYNIPVYVKKLTEQYPKIVSGRKNFFQHHLRIINTIKIVNKYYKKIGIKNI